MSAAPTLEDVAAYAMEHGCGVAEAHREIAYVLSLQEPRATRRPDEDWATASDWRLRRGQVEPLRDVLNARGMTYKQLAALTGHNYQKLSGIVSGRSRMLKFDLAIIADALDLPPDLLVVPDPERVKRDHETSRLEQRAEAAGVHLRWTNDEPGTVAAGILQWLDTGDWRLDLWRDAPWRVTVWAADKAWEWFEQADERQWFAYPERHGKDPRPPYRYLGVRTESAERAARGTFLF